MKGQKIVTVKAEQDGMAWAMTYELHSFALGMTMTMFRTVRTAAGADVDAAIAAVKAHNHMAENIRWMGVKRPVNLAAPSLPPSNSPDYQKRVDEEARMLAVRASGVGA